MRNSSLALLILLWFHLCKPSQSICTGEQPLLERRQPQNQIHLSCTVGVQADTPSPGDLEWKKDGGLITDPRFVFQDGTLQVSNVTVSTGDEGVYQCCVCAICSDNFTLYCKEIMVAVE